MSLYNPMSIQNLFNNNLIIKSQFSFVNRNAKNTFASTYENHSINSKYYRLSLTVSKNTNRDIEMNSFANKKLVSRNFITKLINKYWQETIFLSQPTVLSEMYSNQLRSEGLAVYKNQHKKFLFHFSKALISGRIDTTLEQSKEIKNLKEIKYVWKKGFNFLQCRQFIKFSKQLNSLNQNQLKIVKKLQQNKLPVFTTINNSNQIIVAEPSDELINQKGLLDQMYQFYGDRSLKKVDNKLMHEVLFFINPDDALEYKDSIEDKYIYNSNSVNFNILATGLDFYYKLVKLSPFRIQYYLIPDLQELGNLICKYQYNKNIQFHVDQKYGKDLFQGQPVYIIKNVLCKNKKTGHVDLVKYNYHLNGDKQYETVFLNYEVALLAWQKFVIQNDHYRLPSTPNVLVHNLEDFLKLYEQRKLIETKNLLFIPRQKSYKFIKNNITQKSQQYFIEAFTKKFSRFQIITKRIIWSLTSRQPINW